MTVARPVLSLLRKDTSTVTFALVARRCLHHDQPIVQSVLRIETPSAMNAIHLVPSVPSTFSEDTAITLGGGATDQS
jgi:hypothetical protein